MLSPSAVSCLVGALLSAHLDHSSVHISGMEQNGIKVRQGSEKFAVVGYKAVGLRALSRDKGLITETKSPVSEMEIIVKI